MEKYVHPLQLVRVNSVSSFIHSWLCLSSEWQANMLPRTLLGLKLSTRLCLVSLVRLKKVAKGSAAGVGHTT